MKTIALFFSIALLTGPTAVRSAAQCAFDPVVTGDPLICPESSVTLGTQSYDGYQWYSRAFPNGAVQPISGATDSILDVDYNQTPVYIFVAATKAGCTENSPEILVDGLAFLPVTVASEGDFEISPNGEQIICAGDTVFQLLLLPYTQNIQWYKDNDPITGATDDTLIVTEPGNYWVTASPDECPEYSASLGVQIPVIWGNTPGCTTGAPEPIPAFEAHLVPNPAESSLFIGVDAPGTVRLTLYDAMGKIVREAEFIVATEIITTSLPAGVYTVWLQSGKGHVGKRLVIQ